MMSVQQAVLWLLAVAVTRSAAQATVSTIPIALFSDNKCGTPGVTPNASIALDTCIRTVGMQSVFVPATPCSGSSSTHINLYVYSDGSCANRWVFFENLIGQCAGSDNTGQAAGSILISCSSNDPTPQGETVIINVGRTATSSSGSQGNSTTTTNTGTGGGSTTGSGSNSSSGTSVSDNQVCSGWNCLSTGIKAGLIISAGSAIALVIALFIIIDRRCWRGQHSVIGSNYGSMPAQFQQGPSGPHPPVFATGAKLPSVSGISSPASTFVYTGPRSSSGYVSPVLHQPQPSYPPPRSINEELYAQPWTIEQMLRSQQSGTSTTPHDIESIRQQQRSPSSGYAFTMPGSDRVSHRE